MASFTIGAAPWPTGTTVGAYPAAAWPDPRQAPSGAPASSAAVASDQSITFADLADKAAYVAFALGRGVRFMTATAGLQDRVAIPDRERIKALEDRPGSGSGSGGGGSWKDPVATLVDLPASGNGDGDVRLVLASFAAYAWNETTGAWVALASAGGGGGGGSSGGDDLDVPIVAADLAGLGVGDTVGRQGIIRIGAYPDDYSREFVWDGSRWVDIARDEVTSENDTWGMDLANVNPADMTTFRRVTNALPYGKPHSHLESDTTVAAANVTPHDATDLTVVPFFIRGYRVTPTGFSSGHFTGCTWAKVNGSANGTETFPAALTPLWQTGQIGGFGTVALPVDRVGEMYSAGFQLEERASAFMNGSQDGKALQLSVYWINADEGEDFDLPETVPSGGLGTGLILTGPASNLGAPNRTAERGFQMVTGGWSAFSAGTPTKRYLIPVVVARMASGAQDNGEFYNFRYQTRWVSQ